MIPFVVAYISFHDNVLTQEKVWAKSEFDAIARKLGDTLYGDEATVEELKSLAFDMDCMVSAIRID